MTKKFQKMNLQPAPKNTGKRKWASTSDTYGDSFTQNSHTDDNLRHGMTHKDIQQHRAKKTKYNKNENKTTIIDGTENYGFNHYTPDNDNYTTGVVFGRKKNSNYGFQTNSANYYGGN